MNDRITEDKSLATAPPNFIDRPIIIVHAVGGKQRYILDISQIDPLLSDPRGCGIILSDLLDHMAAAYQHTTGRDPKDIRAHIAKVLRDEDRFKDKDPTRGSQIGATVFPKRN